MTTQRKADLLLVLITGFWGCSYYLSDLALGEMPPFALCAVRFLLAFVLLGIVLFPKLRHVNRKACCGRSRQAFPLPSPTSAPPWACCIPPSPTPGLSAPCRR